MNVKKLTALTLSLAMALAMAACGNSAGEGTPGTTGSQAPTGSNAAAPGQNTMPNGDVLDAEQTFNGYLFSEPSTLDSTKGNDSVGGTILTNVMEPLTRMAQDAEGKTFIEPAGASEWKSNEDGTVWTFTIRDNNWSDGVPVKAEDYAYGLRRMMDPATGSPNSYLLLPIKNALKVNNGELPVDELGVQAIDDKTLEITLEAPTPYFMSLTYGRSMMPLRQDIVEKFGDTYGAEIENVVYNGPFIPTSWTHNSEIKAVKNDQYWDKDNVRLTEITWKILNDENAIFNSFDNGSFDTVSTGTPEWIERFTAKEDAHPVYYVTPSVRFNFYNQKDPLFANANIRKAFSLAINREDMAKAIYFDTMMPAYAWVPQGVTTGDLGDFRTQFPDPLKELQTANPDAKALLVTGMEELGLGSDPATLKVTFTLGDTSQWIRNYGEYLQQTFKTSLGIELQLDFNEWSTFQDKINNGEYQLGYMVWGIDYNDPMSMLEIMISSSNAVPTGWVNEEFDSLIRLASTEMDEAKRVELYKKAETILLNQDAVLAPLVNETYHGFYYNYVKNHSTNSFTTTGLKYVYISGRK